MSDHKPMSYTDRSATRGNDGNLSLTSKFNNLVRFLASAVARGSRCPGLVAADRNSRYRLQYLPAGAKFRQRGGVWFEGTGEVVIFGRSGRTATISRDGELTGELAAEVQPMLATLADDPAAAAKRYAAHTGRCCFCFIRLTDERSIQAGYGPICARFYNLPWGRETENLEAVAP